MSDKILNTRVKQKIDTKANWDKAVNFVPLKGEIIVYSDLNKIKVGDGAKKVGELPFLADNDTKVTSAANHYTPTADSSAQLSVDASSTTTATWNSTQLVTGVNLQRDAKGHVTGVTVDSIKMPANPDTHQSIKTLNTSNTAAQTVSSSEAIAGSGTINLHKVAKTGSYNDLNNRPTNLVTTDTEQTVTGTKHFNAITANTIGTGSDANNYFQSQKFRGEGDANTYYHAVDFGYAGHNQVDFYEYGGNYNFYINTQANRDSKQLLFGINPSGIKIPPAAGAKVLGTNADGQVESHSLGIADISSLQSTLDGKVNSSSLATVAKTGSYNDLNNKPALATVATSGSYNDLSHKPDLGAYLPKSGGALTGVVKGGIIDVHPENGGTILSYYTNDLAFLTQRGGSYIMTNTTTNKVLASSSNNNSATNMFDGSPSYYNFSVSAVTDTVVIVIKSPTAYSWSTNGGIGFGNASWRAKSVKIEMGYSATNKGSAQSPDSDVK